MPCSNKNVLLFCFFSSLRSDSSFSFFFFFFVFFFQVVVYVIQTVGIPKWGNRSVLLDPCSSVYRCMLLYIDLPKRMHTSLLCFWGVFSLCTLSLVFLQQTPVDLTCLGCCFVSVWTSSLWVFFSTADITSVFFCLFLLFHFF